MATRVYGAWQGAAASGKITQRAYLDYTVTVDNETTYTINVSSSGIDPWNDTWKDVTVDYSYGATDYTPVTNVYSHLNVSGGSTGVQMSGSRNYTYTKTHSPQSKTVYATTTLNHVVSSAGGANVNGKTSTASITFTIPVKTSYSVTYNANGGTGAPAGQTKWYNENLTLQGGIPTREHYRFKGWATSASSTTVSYNAGSLYTGNAALALYAVWEHIFIPLTTDAVKAIRTEDTQSTTQYDEGSYLYVEFDYTNGHYSGESDLTTSCEIAIDGNTLYSGNLDGSGSFSDYYNISLYSTSDQHNITIHLYNSVDITGKTSSITLMSTKYPIELLADGSMINFGVPIRLKNTWYIDIDTNAQSGVDADIVNALTALGWDDLL